MNAQMTRAAMVALAVRRVALLRGGRRRKRGLDAQAVLHGGRKGAPEAAPRYEDGAGKDDGDKPSEPRKHACQYIDFSVERCAASARAHREAPGFASGS